MVSFESVHHPGDGDFEAGFRACIDTFEAIFGPRTPAAADPSR